MKSKGLKEEEESVVGRIRNFVGYLPGEGHYTAGIMMIILGPLIIPA